jgi:hypothetical protein
MPFPSSFEAHATIWLHRGDRLDPIEVSRRIENALIADGATTLNRDGAYFEYQFPILGSSDATRLQALIQSGTIATHVEGPSIVVNTETHVRLLPIIFLMVLSGGGPSLAGLPLGAGVGGILVTGGFLAFLYYRAAIGFRKYIERLCERISHDLAGAA